MKTNKKKILKVSSAATVIGICHSDKLSTGNTSNKDKGSIQKAHKIHETENQALATDKVHF